MATSPNIVLIQADEMRPFEMGCYRHPVVRTPHLDRLAAEGVRVEHGVSNCPVCMPGRSVLLSGQYARTCCGTLTNTTLHPREGGWMMPQFPTDGRPHLRDTTLPEALRAAGYRTQAIGKWHIESWPNDVGFDHYVIPRAHHCHTAQGYVEDGGREFCPPGWSVEYELERARGFFAQPHDRPFFLYHNISPPHMPLDDAPERYLTMYRPEDVVLRENVAPDMGTNRWEWEARTYLWDFRYYRDHLPYTRNLPEGFDLRALTALYYGAITWVDDTVGALMAALHQSGLAENTIVIVTADHGDNLGSHRRMGKCTLNEESIRVPYLAWAPGRLAPRVVDRQVCSLLDLAPTLLAMADVETPPTMQGRNLTPVLTGERDALEDDWAVIECIGDGAGVRTPTHLYGLPWAGGHRALGETPHCHHDLREDPWEQHTNPAPDARLDGILRDWLARTPWLAEGAP